MDGVGVCGHDDRGGDPGRSVENEGAWCRGCCESEGIPVECDISRLQGQAEEGRGAAELLRISLPGMEFAAGP